MLNGHTVSSSLYAAAFLLVWYQDIVGADYLETTREHPTGELEALGGLPHKSTLLALMFLRGEGNGDFLLQQHCLKEMILLCCRSLDPCPLPELVCATDGAPSPGCQGGPTGWGTRLSSHRLGDRSASRSVCEAAIYISGKGKVLEG